jgi:hypothetical protein
VKAAYLLDATTGTWQRWFRDNPEISTMPKLPSDQPVVALGEAELAPSWSIVFSQPFSQASGNNKVVAMAEFKGDLYALVGTSGVGMQDSAKVYRMDDPGCSKWTDVSPPFSSKANGYSGDMLVFKGYLYAGSENSGLFRTADGKKWESVTGNSPGSSANWAMAEFKGQLYVATGDQIWRVSDDTAVPHVWEPVVGPAPALHQSAFGNLSQYPKATVESLEVFQDHLYAGVGFDDGLGFQLWRTENGTNWTLFRDEAVPPGPILGASIWCHVHALKAAGDHLYAGAYEGQALCRTDGSPNSWECFENVIGDGSLFRFEEHDGKLYLGVSGGTGGPLLYSSADGKNWSPVAGAPTEGPDWLAVTALASYGGDLYVGMLAQSASGSYLVTYRYGAATFCEVPGQSCKLPSNAEKATCPLSEIAPTPTP